MQQFRLVSVYHWCSLPPPHSTICSRTRDVHVLCSSSSCVWSPRRPSVRLCVCVCVSDHGDRNAESVINRASQSVCRRLDDPARLLTKTEASQRRSSGVTQLPRFLRPSHPARPPARPVSNRRGRRIAGRVWSLNEADDRT